MEFILIKTNLTQLNLHFPFFQLAENLPYKRESK